MAGRPKKKPEELMEPLTVRLPPELKKALYKKVKREPVSGVVRRLIEMYVAGEIEPRWEDDEQEKES